MSWARRLTASHPALLLAALALAGTALAGCNSGVGKSRGDARKGGSVVVGLPAAPGALDPALADDQASLQAVSLAYLTPVVYRRSAGSGGTQLVPALAQHLPRASNADTTFRFVFRRGLRYGDGQPLAASDFGHAIERAVILNPRARRALAGVEGVQRFAARPRSRSISGVVVDDRTRTVRIELRAPDPDFARKLASAWAAPVPARTPRRDSTRTPPPGIGPYRLEGPRPGRAYALTRRRGFGMPNAPGGNVDSIAGVVIPSAARRTAETLDGRLDVSEGRPPTAQLPRIRSEDKERYREFPTLGSLFVRFDLAARPFADQDVRRAVAFALDLQTLTRLQGGFLEPSCNLVPSQVPGYARLDPCPYGTREGDADLVRAAQLARRSPDRRARVLVDGGEGPDAGALAAYGVDTLEKIGLRARVARTARQRAGAQMSFALEDPSEPEPGPYLDRVDDSGVRSDAGALERDQTVAEGALRWATLDERVVRAALAVPIGVTTTGVLLSDRMDTANCLRYDAVSGADLGSLCLR